MKSLIAATLLVLGVHAMGNGYAVIVSAETAGTAGWKQVVDALKEKHQATVLVYSNAPEQITGPLRELMPRYACFVATPEEAGRAFVAGVHRLTRKLDDDPYADCLWGILTGYDAAAALRLAQHTTALSVSKVASGTDFAIDRCVEGVWYDELLKNRCVKKQPGRSAVTVQGPDDTTSALVRTLNDYKADLFITSGHATEREWQIGFRYKNGYFRSENGRLYGIDTIGERYPIESPNPKVYLPIGNCLMGHIDGKDAMALAWMSSGGVKQMIGYTVPTWYGYAGWGCLDYFVEQPGRYTFTEAFMANSHALIHRLQKCAPGAEKADPNQTTAALSEWARSEKLTSHDIRGLLYDRDTLAFYGDPAWIARMTPGLRNWQQTLTGTNDTWTFTITPTAGDNSFRPVNENGSQRGYRPFLAFLPKRIRNVHVLQGADLEPVIADDFILLPNRKNSPPARESKIVFRADLMTR